MCELIFVDTKDNLVNILTTYALLLTDGAKNPDGFGIFTEKSGLFKTEIQPNNIDSLSTLIKYKCNSDIILAHVRYASDKKTVNNEKAHPFETEKLIFSHNGGLEFNNPDKYKNRNLIDSEVFLSELNENYGRYLPEALIDTMKNFTGKFAFLIYSKVENMYYIVRGLTAKLYMSRISVNGIDIGFVVNTDDVDLEKSLSVVKDFIFLINGDRLEYTNPLLLHSEKIYYVNNKQLIESGHKVKENKKHFSPINWFKLNVKK
jgi:glucosamine 6-phosphate synthetase-like amidotransferase/phosphosugar isomerase protein